VFDLRLAGAFSFPTLPRVLVPKKLIAERTGHGGLVVAI